MNARSSDRSTPLHFAANLTPANVLTLLDASADIHARDQAGEIPYDIAKSNYRARTDSLDPILRAMLPD